MAAVGYLFGGVRRNVRLSFLFERTVKFCPNSRKSRYFNWLSLPKRSDRLESAGSAQRHHRSAVNHGDVRQRGQTREGRHEQYS